MAVSKGFMELVRILQDGRPLIIKPIRLKPFKTRYAIRAYLARIRIYL